MPYWKMYDLLRQMVVFLLRRQILNSYARHETFRRVGDEGFSDAGV
jgi:hypothetical protein